MTYWGLKPHFWWQSTTKQPTSSRFGCISYQVSMLMQISMDSTQLKLDTSTLDRQDTCCKVPAKQCKTWSPSPPKICRSNLKFQIRTEVVISCQNERPLICINLAASQVQPTSSLYLYTNKWWSSYNVPGAMHHMCPKSLDGRKGLNKINWPNSKQITGCYLRLPCSPLSSKLVSHRSSKLWDNISCLIHQD